MKGLAGSRRFQEWPAQLALSLTIGALGGVLFSFAQLPLAWMLGPLCANLLVAIGGVPVAVPERCRAVFMGVLGLVLGGRITPAFVQQALAWPASVLLLIVGVCTSTAVVALWYRRGCGFDRVSALYSSTPGAMTAMILMGERAGGDPQRITVSQSLRVLIVILTLPALFWHFEATAGASRGYPATEGVWLVLLLPLMIGLGRLLRLPQYSLLGPLLCAALLGVLGVVHFQPPDWAMNLMLWMLGCAIGSRFRGLALRLLLRYAGQTLIASIIVLVIMVGFAELMHQWLQVDRDVAILALAPGGLGEMALVALSLNIDPLFVTFHQLVRVVVLVLLAPLAMRGLLRWRCPPVKHDASR
ncbi:AbrB family transcriptional regulator [Kushneria phosphatilytica]|uniref:AbrB family transcriptional regulator n=1 Tax=Kushneria phosphatilytica TaxID=657387 RepID=A0A1S1NWS0_9GAMM|nr:AbrB family transcriptional regulator [Kushneria phosphatilytica]OHV10277.1 ammonia monooxygenase [Kushneria phosphatilytica]QEL11562.1 AbrB family transcriptional regulator [Kushneria phosphatilytica]